MVMVNDDDFDMGFFILCVWEEYTVCLYVYALGYHTANDNNNNKNTRAEICGRDKWIDDLWRQNAASEE